jgi:hypothetical protein
MAPKYLVGQSHQQQKIVYRHLQTMLHQLVLLILLLPVPDSKSRNIPEVVIVGAGQVEFWEFGKGGSIG